MALKKCKDCGAEVSSTAKVCPNCGRDQRKFFQKHPLITIILIILIIGIVQGTSKENNLNKELNYKGSYQTADLVDIAELSIKDSNQAREKYGDQYIEIIGKVNTIYADEGCFLLSPLDDTYAAYAMRCFVKTKNPDEVMKKISKGEVLRVRGKVFAMGNIALNSLYVIEIYN